MNIGTIYNRLKNTYEKNYRDRGIILQQKSTYMLILSGMFLILVFIIYFSGSSARIPLHLFLTGLFSSIIIFLLVVLGKYRIAQILLWLLCVNEFIYILNPASSDTIVIPEICAITFILILISTSRVENYLIVSLGLISIAARTIYNYTISGRTPAATYHTTVGYICVFAVFICLFLVGKVIRKNARNQELLIKEQKEKLKIYNKIYSLENNLKEKKRQIDFIENRLYIDELTELYNRNAFNDLYVKHVSNSKRNGQPSTITYMDLDRLKYVNDNYGHLTGDRYIKLFASQIVKYIRSNDMAFRVGGDEFVIIFDMCEIEQSENIVMRITDDFPAKCRKFLKGFDSSFSYGSVDLTTHPDLDAYDVLDMADRLMLENKKERRVIRGDS